MLSSRTDTAVLPVIITSLPIKHSQITPERRSIDMLPRRISRFSQSSICPQEASAIQHTVSLTSRSQLHRTNKKPERPLSSACSAPRAQSHSIPISDMRRQSTPYALEYIQSPFRTTCPILSNVTTYPTILHLARYHSVCYSGIPRTSYQLPSQLRSSSPELTHTSAQRHVKSGHS